MEQRRWLDPSQPQTLQNAVVLSYVFAFFGLLYLITTGGQLVWLANIVGGVGAWGIANEKRWGYWLDVVAASVNLLASLAILAVGFGIFALLNAAFAVALVTLLLHPQSREYQRIWFK